LSMHGHNAGTCPLCEIQPAMHQKPWLRRQLGLSLVALCAFWMLSQTILTLRMILPHEPVGSFCGRSVYPGHVSEVKLSRTAHSHRVTLETQQPKMTSKPRQPNYIDASVVAWPGPTCAWCLALSAISPARFCAASTFCPTLALVLSMASPGGGGERRAKGGGTGQHYLCAV
jgi:hypothetical protein